MKGIWLPTELLDLDISWTKRILIAEISQLEMLDKGCIASNSHFSQKLRLSKQAVSKALNELSDEGYIFINNAQSKRNFGREITINFGKSGINFGKSPIHESGESKGRIQINKIIDYDLENISLYAELNDKEKMLYNEYLELRKTLKLKTTLKIHTRLLEKYFSFGRNIEVIEKAINSNWKDFYQINSLTPKQQKKRFEDMSLEEKIEYNEQERQRKIEANYGSL